MRVALIMSSAILIAGCASGRPVLYPNATYDLAGPQEARRTISDCLDRAQAFGAHDPATDVIGHTAAGAFSGALVGAAVGSVVGEAGFGARAGAAHGAASGLLHGIAHAQYPDYTAQAFVERCLAENGYEVIGWR